MVAPMIRFIVGSAFTAALLFSLGCGPDGGKIVVDHGTNNPVPEDRLIVDDSTVGGGPWTVGHYGGAVIYPTIGDPKSFNWVVNNDQNTSDVGRLAYSDLISTNKYTQRTEPELAKSFEISPDNTSITVHLRKGLQWSDGEPYTMDDVLFTWYAVWNPHISTPARDALSVQDPATGEDRYFYMEKLDDWTLRVVSQKPFAILDRIFSEIWMVPRHEFADIAGHFDPVKEMPSIEQAGFVISPATLAAEARKSSDAKIYWEVWFQPELKRLGRFVADGADQDPANLAKIEAYLTQVTAWDKRMSTWAAEFSAGWSTDLATTANDAAAHFCTMGPFRIARYETGQYAVYTANPFYWKFDKTGQRLPYLDKFYIWTVQNQDTMMVKFSSGEGDILSPVLPTDVAALKKTEHAVGTPGYRLDGYTVYEVGARLQDNHYYFNLNRAWRATIKVKNGDGKDEDTVFYRYPDVPSIADRFYKDFKIEVRDAAMLATLHQHLGEFKPIVEPSKAKVFQNVWFRRATSSATDREAIAQNIFAGLAKPGWSSIGPGYKDWHSPNVTKFPYDLAKAAEYLDRAGMTRRGSDGYRLTPDGKPFSFTINTNANNEQRVQIATLLAGALQKLGINAAIQPLDFNSLLDKIQSSFEFDCIILGLGGGDVDQASNGNVYRSGGFTHVWATKQPVPMTPEEAEVDKIFDTVQTGATLQERVAAMNRIDEIFCQQQFYIHTYVNTLFVAGRNDIGNFKPALMENNAYWNAYLFYRGEKGAPAGGVAAAPGSAPTAAAPPPAIPVTTAAPASSADAPATR